MVVHFLDLVIVFPTVVNHFVYVVDFLVHIFVIQLAALDAVVIQQFVAVAMIIVVVRQERQGSGGGRWGRCAVLCYCGRRR